MIEPAKELAKKDEEHKEGGKKGRKAVVYVETIDPCKKNRILSPEGQML